MPVKIIKKTNKFVVFSNYDKKLLQLVRTYPGAKWDAKNREWLLSNQFYDSFMLQLQKSYFRHEFEFEEQNASKIYKQKKQPDVEITIQDNHIVADFKRQIISEELHELTKKKSNTYHSIGDNLFDPFATTLTIAKDKEFQLFEILKKEKMPWCIKKNKFQISSEQMPAVKSIDERVQILINKEKTKQSDCRINLERKEMCLKNKAIDKILKTNAQITESIETSRRSMIEHLNNHSQKIAEVNNNNDQTNQISINKSN